MSIILRTVEWCTRNYYTNINFDAGNICTHYVDMLDFKLQFSRFLLLFAKNFLLGVNCQTRMINMYMTRYMTRFNHFYDIELMTPPCMIGRGNNKENKNNNNISTGYENDTSEIKTMLRETKNNNNIKLPLQK